MATLNTLFADRKKIGANFELREFVNQLQDDITSAGSSLALGTQVAESISNESFNENEVKSNLEGAYDALERTLTGLGFENFNIKRPDAERVSTLQKTAAVMALAAAGSESAYKKALLAST